MDLCQEAFSNIRTVKAFSTEDHETMRYMERNEKIFAAEKCNGYGYGFFTAFITIFMFGSIDALAYFASYLIRDGRLDIG